MRISATKRPTRLLTIISAVVCTVAMLTAVSDPAEAGPKPAAVTTVTIKSAKVHGKKASVTLKWKKASKAKKYEVRWSKKPSMKKASKKTVKGKKTTVRGLKANKTWCFQVRGLNGNKKGKKSTPICERLGKVGQADVPWVSAQQLVGGLVSLTVRWPRVAGAKSYELDYAPTAEPVADNPVQGNKARKTLTVASAGDGEQVGVVSGLAPGQIYCFQVRAIGGGGPGRRGARHCKQTMPANRGPVSPAVPLDVGSWNICAIACTGDHAIGPRLPGIAARILGMGVDVIGLQETSMPATNSIASSLHNSGYDLGCRTADDGQSLLVQTRRFDLVSNGQVEFAGDTSHGACWARIRDKVSQKEVIVSSVHLKNDDRANGGGSEDNVRLAQMRQLVAAINAGPTSLVLAGDFNSSRSRYPDQVRAFLNGQGIDEAYDIAGVYESHTHYSSANEWKEKADTATLWGAHIDRVFVSPNIHVLTWGVVEPMAGGKYTNLLSNHSPLRVRLSVGTP